MTPTEQLQSLKNSASALFGVERTFAEQLVASYAPRISQYAILAGQGDVVAGEDLADLYAQIKLDLISEGLSIEGQTEGKIAGWVVTAISFIALA